MPKEPPSALTRAFAAVLRDRRKERGLSQEQLGYASDLHRTYISQLERGLKSPSLAAVESLAHALDIPAHELIREAEKSG